MVSLRSPDPVHILESSLSIPATDGYVLGGSRFEPTRRLYPKLVVINGATGVPHRFYRHFAAYLATAGFDVVTYDYRGIGASRRGSVRKLPATMSDWGVRDFEGVLRYAREVMGYRAVDLVGHSVGGQLVGFAESSSMLDRIVGVASQLGDYRFWDKPHRLHVMIAMYIVLPLVVRVLGYLPARLIGEDLPPGVALEWKRWCTTPGYFVSELSELEHDRFRRHSGDVLAYSFENDQYAPPRAVDAWLDLFASASVRREHVDDARVGHFGFFRPTSDVTRWADVADFLSAA